jgi:hypothetical protein
VLDTAAGLLAEYSWTHDGGGHPPSTRPAQLAGHLNEVLAAEGWDVLRLAEQYFGCDIEECANPVRALELMRAMVGEAVT